MWMMLLHLQHSCVMLNLKIRSIAKKIIFQKTKKINKNIYYHIFLVIYNPMMRWVDIEVPNDYVFGELKMLLPN